MARKSPTASRAPKKRASPSKPVIAEPFQMVRASISRAGKKTVKVPELRIRGEWLRHCGFPIDSAAYLTLDERGEMTAHRLGLRVTRRIRIRAVKV